MAPCPADGAIDEVAALGEQQEPQPDTSHHRNDGVTLPGPGHTGRFLRIGSEPPPHQLLPLQLGYPYRVESDVNRAERPAGGV